MIFIIQEISRCTNMASAKFQESQGKIEVSVNNIKSSEEYSEFIDRNKTSPPKPILFKFDAALLENVGCKLKPNEISVDELTVDVLRQFMFIWKNFNYGWGLCTLGTFWIHVFGKWIMYTYVCCFWFASWKIEFETSEVALGFVIKGTESLKIT